MERVTETIGIRLATPDDAAQIARIHVESWQSTYAGLLPDRVLLDLDEAQQKARWRTTLRNRTRQHRVYVAVKDERQVVGFASSGPSRTMSRRYEAEVYTLYVSDSWRGLGIGRILFASAACGALNRNNASLIVWCLGANPSRFFYERLGGIRTGTRMTRIGGALLEETGFGWRDGTELASWSRI